METQVQTRKQAQPIYLDYNATTPVDPLVFAAMEPYFKMHFGNAASAGHPWGWSAAKAVQTAREQVARLIHGKASEITFTSGATESNNTAIFGLVTKLREDFPNQEIHFITSNVEHSSVMAAMKAVKNWGVEVDFLPVNEFGQVTPEQIKKALRPTTRLISLIWVNNEIGTINPIPEIAQLARANKTYLHTDATQAVGKIDIDVVTDGIDMMSFSAHKIYGPKGVGALYLRGKDPKVSINPLIYGGGQEAGLRSGTVNVPGVVGFGMAAQLCQELQGTESKKLRKLTEFFWQELQAAIPGIKLNGHPTQRAPNNLNVTLPFHKTEQIMGKVHRLGFSTGSACGTGAMTVSHVLLGLGLTPDAVQRSFRVSLGRWTDEEQVLGAIEILKDALK